MKIHIDQTDASGVVFTQNGPGNTYSAVVTIGGDIRIPVTVMAESTKTTNGVVRTMLKVTARIPKDIRYDSVTGHLSPSMQNGTEDVTFHTVLTSGRTFNILRASMGQEASFADSLLRMLVGFMISLIASNKSISALAIGDPAGVPSASYTPFTRALDDAWPLDGSATYGNETVP